MSRLEPNAADEQFFERMRAKLDAAFAVLRELDDQLRDNRERRQRVASFDEATVTAPLERTMAAVVLAGREPTPSEMRRAEERAELLSYVENVYNEAMQLAARPPAVSNAQEREIVRRITVRATVAAAELDWRRAQHDHTEEVDTHAERLVRQRAQTELARSDEPDDAVIDLVAPSRPQRGRPVVAALALMSVLIASGIWVLTSRHEKAAPALASTRTVVLEPITLPLEGPPPRTRSTMTSDAAPSLERRLVKQQRTHRQRVSIRARRGQTRSARTTRG